MKILVLSDSHAALRFMRYCITRIKPDTVVHLGDYFDDGKVMAEEFPHIRFHQVPGNCDRYRCAPWHPDIMCYDIAGVRFYMTHGHKHGVKSGVDRLLADARAAAAKIILYGHTHIAHCEKIDPDMWLLNPGSCGSDGGSAGLIVINKGQISSCRIVRQEDMERSI